MFKRGRSPGGAVRTAALVASGVLHAVLLVLLVRYAARGTPTHREPPTIQAMLVPPDRPGPTHRDRLRPPSSDDRDALARAAPVLPVQAATPHPGEVAPFTPGDALPDTTAPSEADVAAKALRGLRGCDRVELTRQEREDCEAQRWARAAPVTARLNLDLSGRYAKNPEPFLLRRPKKGCRARMGGDPDARGDDSNVRAGVTCVKPF
jgi:hypothetical protein